ncbi:MAG: hypothetical protein JO271_03235 [Verrucomicrobia bacterium]|nr:hypothetical protein [Verrucomicrobiota bacterium]MBV9273756.1 hypothetical protein [Verrucomicrobiota bacterium]
MSFFSWFKSKSAKSDQDESQLRESTGPQEKEIASGVRPSSPVRVAPRLRDLVPQSQPKHPTEATPKETFPTPVTAAEIQRSEKELTPATTTSVPNVGADDEKAPPETQSKPVEEAVPPPIPQDLLKESGTEARPPSLSSKQIELPASPPLTGYVGQSIRLPLKPILENLPPEFQPSGIARLFNEPALTIDLPLELIHSQIANGKVTLPYSDFLRLLPREARIHFADTANAEEVPIPVKEIVPNYPTNLLHPRPDQEPEEKVPPITTPFADAVKQAAEKEPVNKTGPDREGAADSKQLELIGRPKPSVEARRDLSGEQALKGFGSLEPNLRALQSIFLAETSLDLNQVIQKVGELPGISAALLFGPGGKVLEGDPEKLGLTPAAVQLLSDLANQAGKQAEGLGFGPVETMTLGWARELISVFVRGQTGIVVRHSRRPFKPGVREKIGLVLSHISN